MFVFCVCMPVHLCLSQNTLVAAVVSLDLCSWHPPGDRDINLARISSSRIKVTRTHVLSLHRGVYTYIHPCTLVICPPCHISYATIRGGPPKAKPYCSVGNRFQLFDFLSRQNLKFHQLSTFVPTSLVFR